MVSKVYKYFSGGIYVLLLHFDDLLRHHLLEMCRFRRIRPLHIHGTNLHHLLSVSDIYRVWEKLFRCFSAMWIKFLPKHFWIDRHSVSQFYIARNILIPLYNNEFKYNLIWPLRMKWKQNQCFPMPSTLFQNCNWAD